MDERTRLCKFYFELGLSYYHILSILAHVHSIVISMSTLKRVLRKQKLYRRKNHADLLDVAVFIEDIINKNGTQHGYRWMHLQCRHHGLNISRDEVRMLMQILDPTGVELRLSRRLRRRQYNAQGPNFLWHLDSYDKLKRYGLCINGCIDGFSRCIMWLNAFHTSSDPRVVAGYFIETVRAKEGCPYFIRGDLGTENGHVAEMQKFLTERESFIYGRSTSNQRIEMLWNFLRRQCCQYWMDFLGTLSEEGIFDGYWIDKNLLQFCFLQLLQKDLDEFALSWNTHHIRHTKNQNCPHGRPLVMYTVPTLYNANEFLQDTAEQKIDVCTEECIFRKDITASDEHLAELCRIYMEENGWRYPTDVEEGLELYRNLRVLLLDDLNAE